MKININNIFLIFLPFTQALTVNVLFPLKISEIALFIIIFFHLNKTIISQPTLWFIKQNKYIIILSIFVTLSFIVNIWWHYDYDPKLIPFRINRVGDSFIRLCYFYLCIFAYYFSFKIFSRKLEFLNKWLLGSIIAIGFGWYLFVFSGLQLPYIKLFGMEEEPQMLYGFIRCGTFKEGNFFGLFLVLSSSIAFYLKKNKLAFFLILSTTTTMSTISLVSSLILLLFYFRKKILSIKTIMFLIPFIILFSLFFVNTEYFKENIYAKIFDPVKEVTTGNYSKVERTITGSVAFYSGLANPFFGVGPANYGVHYDHYNYTKKIVKVRNIYIDKRMERNFERAIPNNVYLEIFSEYGFFGFLAFSIFLLSTLIISYRSNEDAITGGVLALIVSLNAFPSFIMLFIWVFLSIPLAIRWNQLNFKKSNS